MSSARRAAVTLAATALAAAALPAATASAATAAPAAPAAAAPITVTSPASGGFHLSSATHRAGTVPFHFVSKAPLDSSGNGGTDVAILQLRNGGTKAQLIANIRAQQGKGAAASTRWLVQHTTLYGGAGISGLGTADARINLVKGDYLVADINSIFSGAKTPQLTTLHITGTVATLPPPRVTATISTTTAERFQVSSASFKAGTVLVRNVSNSIHFVAFQPVKAGTTDALMTKVADAELHGTKPPSNPYDSTREAVESDVLSPGQQQYFASPILKPGTYDMECYIADDMSGLPHFFMGMHKVIVVK